MMAATSAVMTMMTVVTVTAVITVMSAATEQRPEEVSESHDVPLSRPEKARIYRSLIWSACLHLNPAFMRARE